MITNNIKILEHNFNFNFYSSHQVSAVIQKTPTISEILYRFRTAPTKIKGHLYLALIRPLLEQPSSQLISCGITNTKKLQQIRTRAWDLPVMYILLTK